MKILVTGEAGHIGSLTVEHLVGHGVLVVVLDNFCLGYEVIVHLGGYGDGA